MAPNHLRTATGSLPRARASRPRKLLIGFDMKALTDRFAGFLQLGFVVFVVGVAVFASAAMKPDGKPTRSRRADDAVAVAVFEPVTTAYRPTIALNGVVESRTLTDIIPQVGGRVVEVSPSFRPGAEVNAGSVLFVIEQADYELAVERTLAEISAAESQLALLEAQSEAERRVWAQQSPNRPITDLVAKVPEIAAAKARIRAARAARRAAELELERTVVHAPSDARVLSTTLGVGQVVNPNAAVGRIFAVDSLEIGVPVSADELARIGDDGEVRIQLRGQQDAPITGFIARVSASLDERTRLGKVFIGSDAVDRLTLGEFVEVEIEGRRTPDAMRIPASALTSRDRTWVVDDGKLAPRRIEVLGREGDTTLVRSFDVGAGVVPIPPANARSGLEVRVQDAGGIDTAAPAVAAER